MTQKFSVARKCHVCRNMTRDMSGFCHLHVRNSKRPVANVQVDHRYLLRPEINRVEQEIPMHVAGESVVSIVNARGHEFQELSARFASRIVNGVGDADLDRVAFEADTHSARFSDLAKSADDPERAEAWRRLSVIWRKVSLRAQMEQSIRIMRSEESAIKTA